MTNKITQQPLWIWHPDQKQKVNQYMEFRRNFELNEINDAELYLSADSNFIAKINGKIVGTGQFSDFPNKKSFSRMQITDALVQGNNVLSVLVHYCGADHFSYIPGKPRLWFSLRTKDKEINSDAKTLCRASPTYRQGDMARITIMMGFTFEYNAKSNDNWMTPEYNPDKTWCQAIPLNDACLPAERPVAMLELKPKTNCHIITEGLLTRGKNETNVIADIMQHDFLSNRRTVELFDNIPPNKEVFVEVPVTITPESVTGSDGAYIIIDMEREECGFIDIEIDSGSGTIIDIAIGEHLADMRVRAQIGPRNFASRYICGNGYQHFTHHSNRYAGRYLELHITKISNPFTLHYAGLIPAEYPLQMRGKFESPDTQMNQIFRLSQRTLHLCMHEHYEDCPWREQALYANDSRIQALTGYYAIGEYNFPRVSFDLLAQSVGKDGYQDLCAPMRFDFTIPSFTMSWFLAIADHLRFSGDITAAQQQLPRIQKMIAAYQPTLINELLPSPQGKRYWHFYDWAGAEISGQTVHPTKGGLTEIRFDAPLNLFFILALRAASEIATACNEPTLAAEWLHQSDRTATESQKIFWNKQNNAYETFVGEQATQNHFAELTQSLAILCKLPTKEQAHKLKTKLSQSNNDWVETTLSQSLYKFEALLTDHKSFSVDVFNKVSADWGYMLNQGATSFWETIKGEADFCSAGSLCHGWSALPAYLYQAYLLGVRPTTPGFTTFEINPLLTIINEASGQIPTPAGPITVAWRKNGDNYAGEISYPETLKPLFVNKNNVKFDWKIEPNEGAKE